MGFRQGRRKGENKLVNNIKLILFDVMYCVTKDKRLVPMYNNTRFLILIK